MNFSSNLKSVLSPSFLIGTSILFGWTIIAIGATEFAPFDPMATVGGSRKPPSFEFLFGTDRLGRDVLSRIIYGSRISLLLGFVSVSIGAIIGTTLGLISGYYGRYVDTVIMRTIDAMLAFPGILLALVIIAALGASITNVMLAVGVSTIPRYARLVRSNVLLIKRQAYIDQARLSGMSDIKILIRHVLPNTATSLFVLSTLQFGNAITVGAGLSFLGMGAQPPTAEWGLMSAVGREVLGRAWWISTFPGFAIFSAVMACNLLGDSLHKIIDPRLDSNWSE